MENRRRTNDRNSSSVFYRRSSRIETRLTTGQHLPIYKTELSSISELGLFQDYFRTCCKKHGFYISEATDTSITAVYSKKPGLISFFSCFSSDDRSRTSAVVRLSVSIHSRTQGISLTVRGLQGPSGKISELVESFKSAFSSAESAKSATIMDSPGLSTPNITPYEVSKLLSSSEILSKLTDFFNEWNQKYVDMEFASGTLPEALTEVKNIVEEILCSIVSSLKPRDALKMTQKCRPSVEKYVYSKIMHSLNDIYSSKYEERQRMFFDKLQRISQIPKQSLMNMLELKNKFRLEETTFPYHSAIEVFDLLKNCQTPLDKMNIVLEAVTLMKTSVLDYWKGKEELSTMDDQFPVLIFVVSQVKVPNFVPQICFLRDYISGALGFDNEQKILLDIDSAVSYILNEFNI